MRTICSLLAAAILLSGCTTVELTTRSLDVPVGFTGNVNKKFTVVKHFRKEQKARFLFFNLVTISEPDLGQLLREEIQSAQGDAVANVSIQGQTSLADGGIPLLTGALGFLAVPPAGALLGFMFSARTYTIEGDVIHYSE